MKSLRDLMDLSGRVALVTGAAGHIGSKVCHALAELGADLLLLDRDREGLDRVAGRIQDNWGAGTHPLHCDLSDEGEIRRTAASVESDPGRLDVLVNCAALGGDAEVSGYDVPFAQQEIETWRLALEVNLTAPFLLTQLLHPMLAHAGRGSVVNITSIYGVVGPDLDLYDGLPMGNPAAYAASKGGLVQLTRWLATALAPEVRVNAISPGGVERNQPEEFRQRYEERTPVGRMAREEDLKGAVAYLASDLSAYVTGENLMVDGGWTAW